MTADEFHRLYEEATRDAYKKGKAILDEAVEKADARRRFQVDSQGCTVVAYIEEAER